MARRSKTWRALKWGGAAVCVLLASMCGATVHTYRSVCCVNRPSGLSVGIVAGDLWIVQRPEHAPVATDGNVVFLVPDPLVYFVRKTIHRSENPFGWPTVRSGPYLRVTVPLWIPFLLLAVPTARLWWLDRRRMPPGHCPRCGYDLTGNVSGRCPECGNAALSAAHPEPIPKLGQP